MVMRKVNSCWWNKTGQRDDRTTNHTTKGTICTNVVVRGKDKAIQAVLEHIVDLPCDIGKDYRIRVRRNEVTGVERGKDI